MRAPLSATARIADAERAVAALDAAARALPNVAELCAGALRVDAVASARLDGHDVTLAELLIHEAASPVLGTDPVCNMPSAGVAAAARYLDAVRHGQRRLAAEGALSGDILLDVLSRLLAQSSAGGTIPAAVMTAIATLDRTRDDERGRGSAAGTVAATTHALAPLTAQLKECAALARIGALLALCGGLHPWRALVAPSVRAMRGRCTPARGRGAVNPPDEPPCPLERASLAAATGIIDGVAAALSLMQRTSRLTADNERRIGAFSGAAHSARLIHVAFQADPVTTLPRLLCDTGLRIQAATSALHRLRALGILREVTGRRRHRVYSYDGWVVLLNEPLCEVAHPAAGTLSARDDV